MAASLSVGQSLLLITGAGCPTDEGQWKIKKPPWSWMDLLIRAPACCPLKYQTSLSSSPPDLTGKSVENRDGQMSTGVTHGYPGPASLPPFLQQRPGPEHHPGPASLLSECSVERQQLIPPSCIMQDMQDLSE